MAIYDKMTPLKNEVLNADGSTSTFSDIPLRPADETRAALYLKMHPIKNEVLNSDGSTSPLVGTPEPTKLGFGAFKLTENLAVPTKPTPIEFNNLDFSNSNEYFTLVGDSEIQILKTGIYALTVKVNAEKTGGAIVGDYHIGYSKDLGEPLKGTWNTFRPTEINSDISTQLLSGQLYLEAGDTLLIIHYEGGGGEISLVNDALNFPLAGSITFMGEV